MDKVIIIFLKLFSVTTLVTFTVVLIQFVNDKEGSFYEDAYLHKLFE
mgnify:CR=1 FL=1|uniref:Uncharacterized protein n=1 Tax=viral metagenome TaxID=1070528 RepID=A0A6C0J988_9ZZZZ